MKRLATAFLAAVGLAGCFDDPTSDGRNGPSRFALSANQLFMTVAETATVEVAILDDQGNTLPGIVDFTSGSATVATAAFLDTVPGRMSTTGRVVAQGTGETYVQLVSGSVIDSVRVVVVPTAFTGTIAPATAAIGDVVTVTAPAGMVFNTATADVTVGGYHPWILSVTATTITFVAPAVVPAGSVVSIDGAVFVGTVNMPTLDATTTMEITDPSEPGNDAPATGSVIALPAAVGGEAYGYGALDDSDIDDFFVITTTTGDSLRVEVEWPNHTIDIDAFVLSAAGGGFCVLDACSGASSADPEVMRVRLAAATTYTIYVNMYDTHGEPVPEPYRVKITRVQ